MSDEKRPVGRPPNVYTDEQREQIRALAGIMCTYREIESITGIPLGVLEDNFRTIIEKAKDSGRESLRRRQWHAAESGDKTMLIWLGKQWLGQTDQVDVRSFVAPMIKQITTEELQDAGPETVIALRNLIYEDAEWEDIEPGEDKPGELCEGGNGSHD